MKFRSVYITIAFLLCIPCGSVAQLQVTWGWVTGTPAIARFQTNAQYAECWYGNIQSPAYPVIITLNGEQAHFYNASTGVELMGSPIMRSQEHNIHFVGCLDVDGDGLDEVILAAGGATAMVEWLGPSDIDWNPETAPEQSVPSLGQNHPNPFNPKTTISYTVPADGQVQLAIYDVRGRKLKTLTDGSQAAGSYTIQWDGTDNGGGRVASGTYFYQLVVDGQAQSKKMLVLK